jgi:hypothetical protein
MKYKGVINMDFRNNFISTLKEEDQSSNSLPIPPRKKNILELHQEKQQEEPEIPPRKEGLLDKVLQNITPEYVTNEISSRWNELMETYPKPSTLMDMIMDEHYNWMYLKKENAMAVYKELYKLTSQGEDTEDRAETLEYMRKKMIR